MAMVDQYLIKRYARCGRPCANLAWYPIDVCAQLHAVTVASRLAMPTLVHVRREFAAGTVSG